MRSATSRGMATSVAAGPRAAGSNPSGRQGFTGEARSITVTRNVLSLAANAVMTILPAVGEASFPRVRTALSLDPSASS